MIRSFRGKYSFLSNFYVRETNFGGLVLPSVEHYFQLAKADSMESAITALKKIYKEVTSENFDQIYYDLRPKMAKRFGRLVSLRPGWKKDCNSFMVTGVMSKYWQHHDLRAQLLETGDEILVEGNTWHDNYWGDCECSKCTGIVGQNTLGRITMATRSYFRGLENVL